MTNLSRMLILFLCAGVYFDEQHPTIAGATGEDVRIYGRREIGGGCSNDLERTSEQSQFCLRRSCHTICKQVMILYFKCLLRPISIRNWRKKKKCPSRMENWAAKIIVCTISPFKRDFQKVWFVLILIHFLLYIFSILNGRSIKDNRLSS